MRRAAGGDADVTGDREDGRRVVARQDLDHDALGGEERDGLGRVGAQRLGEDGNAERTGRRRPCLEIGGQRVGRRCHGHDPPACLLILPDPRREVAEAEELGRAEDDRLRTKLHGAPAPTRRERRHLRRLLGRGRERIGQSLGGRVPCRARRGEAAERLLDSRPVDAGARHDVGDTDPRVGQRPGLVDAEGVDRGKRLDRVQLLHESSEPGEADGGGGERQRDEEDEALGDERDHARDGGLDRVADADVLPLERDDEDHAQRDHGADQHEEQTVDLALEGRTGMAELARRARDPLRVRVRAGSGDEEGAGALEDEAPRPHLLSARARDAAGLAGQDRLVEHEAVALDEISVGRHLVAGAEPHEVAGNDLPDGDRSRLAAADDDGVRGHERGEPLELVLRPYLLPDPDSGVGDDDPEEERVAPVGEGEREDAESQQDRVEGRQHVGADDAGGRPDVRLPVATAPRRQPPLRLSLRKADHVCRVCARLLGEAPT